MKAVDTNVLVRVITRDDPVQTPIALKVFEEPVFLSFGVLIETEWVLRSSYRFKVADVIAAFERVLRLGTVSVPDIDSLLWCLDRHAAGMDFADAVHIASATHATSFLTFEARVDVLAGPDAPVRIERLQ